MELIAGLANTVAIVGVDDEDDTLGVLVVVAPERANLVLAADVPHGERDVLVLDSLDVEADGRDGRHDLTKLELVEDGGLAGGVEADHEDAHILLAEEALEHLREPVHAQGTLPGIILFICYALTGFYIWLKNVRILKQLSSPIIASQARLWFSKACFDITMASVLITALMFDEYTWSLYLDPLASLVGAGFLIHGAWAITSSSVGDLLDVSLEESTQLVILRELVKHFDDYDALHKIRSRRSGSIVFIEIFMCFDPELKMLEVTKRIERLHDNISDSVPGAQVLIIPTRVPNQ